MKNPQGFQTINALMQNNNEPMSIIKQIMGNIKPEDKQQLLNTVKGLGCPDNILAQFQNMK